MEKLLTLYHGSRSGLVGPIRPDRSDGACDFGPGFYMGTDIHQPQTLICEERDPVLYTLSLDLAGLKVYRFDVDTDWALFVAFNRGKLENLRFRCENQRRRGVAEADRICRELRREGESFHEVVSRLIREGGEVA